MRKRTVAIAALVALLISILPFAAFAEGSFCVSEISVPSGELAFDAGQIVLAFTEEVDAATLGAITFTKADGSPVKGGAYALVGDNPMLVIVKFGILELGDYLLEVGEGLRAANGAAVIAESYTYMVSEILPGRILRSVDFGVFETGSIISDTIAETYPYVSMSASANGEVISGASGEKMLKLWTEGKYKGANIALNLEEGIEKGTIIIDLEFGGSDDGMLTKWFAGLRNASGIKTKLYTFTSKSGLTLVSGSNGTTATSWKSPKLDEDGMFRTRTILSRNSVGEDWKVSGYDMNNDGAEIFRATDKDTSLDELKGIQLTETYPMTDEPAKAGHVLVKRATVMAVPSPEVIYSDAVIKPDGDLKLAFNTDIEESQLDCSLVHAITGEEVEAVFSLDGDQRTVTVSPKAYLLYGTDYEIRFNNDLVAPIAFRTETTAVTVTDVTKNLNYLNVGFDMHVEGTYTIGLIAAGYNASGQLLAAVREDKTITIDNKVAMIDVAELSSYDEVRLYVWEKGEGYTRSLCAPMVLGH